ncbi:unnamed protein product, partial [Symbiodinium microadriaticum]
WYVNASSFDKVACVYFALVNNFPGKSNSTQDQKLAVADFSQNAAVVTPPVDLLDIVSGDVMMQFIAYSSSQELLFFSGPSKLGDSRQATVGVLCHKHGKIHSVLAVMDDVQAVGPIVADDSTSRVLFFMKLSAEPNTWRLFSVGYTEGSTVTEVHTYEGDAYVSFAAAGYMA